MSRVLFSSICTGEIYLNWAIVCLTGFRELVHEPVIWELCVEEEWEERLRNRLKHLEDDNFKLMYTRLGTVSNEIDVNKYITLGWTSYKSADYFMWRIKHLDELKKSGNWDTVITVDLDAIFINNPMYLIDKFIKSGLTYGGTREPYNPVISFKQQQKDISYEEDFPLKTYFNLGFGFLNLNKLPDHMWDMYKKISKGKEDWFNTQDQSFFSYIIDDNEKLILDDAQIVAHCLWRKEYRIKRNPCLIHFSPKSAAMWDHLDSTYLGSYHILKLKYFKKFADLVEKCSDYIPDNYIKNVRTNIRFVKSVFRCKTNFIDTLINFYSI